MPDLTETDRKILGALRANARMSITELSQRLGVARATAKQRLEALVRTGRIRRFTIETDTDIDGRIRAITLIALQGKMSRAVIRALGKIPEVSSIHSTNGSWDLVVEIQTEDLPRFDGVLREIREVPGVTNSESCLLLARVSS